MLLLLILMAELLLSGTDDHLLKSLTIVGTVIKGRDILKYQSITESNPPF